MTANQTQLCYDQDDLPLYMADLQAWQEAECSSNWCQAAGLNMRGMRFARDVEGQLEAAIESSRSTFFERPLQDGSIGRSRKRRRTGHSSGMLLPLGLLSALSVAM